MTTAAEEARANAAVLDIKDYPNWYTNGHRELHCRCGKAHTFRRFELQGGRAVARVEGRCGTCGDITITSGKWRRSRTRTAPPRAASPTHEVTSSWSACSPETARTSSTGRSATHSPSMTPVAKVYGDARFSYGEGFHGTAVKRFKLLKTKGYYKKKAQAEVHAVMVFCVMHGLTMRQRAKQDEAELVAAA